MKPTYFIIAVLILFVYHLFGYGQPMKHEMNGGDQPEGGIGMNYKSDAMNDDYRLFLPALMSPKSLSPRVNVPYFENGIRYRESAVFWFGRVTPTENYADVRVGYNDQELFVHLTIFDRQLWYDPSPASENLTGWDAVTLYLNLENNPGNAPSTQTYRFIAQLNWWEERENWQAAYRGNGTGWSNSEIPFVTTSGWRGNALNDHIDDDGWSIEFRIPFASLGYHTTPQHGSVWGLALSLHDRDDAVGTPIPDITWPQGIEILQPSTWGQLRFGLPVYTSPPVEPSGSAIIRHGLDGIQVVDGHVGGSTNCGQPYWPNFFDGWGDANYIGDEQVNIQNQADVADWPCFSKFYLTFPLDTLPANKVLISATLRLYLFGNSGQGSQPTPQPSLIQVLTVEDDWTEGKLTWNNAPLAFENIAQTWVYPVDEFPGWPGVPYEWDVSRAAVQAYLSGEQLRLVLYSADAAIHSGKYFISSDTEEWNAEGRPTLELIWGEQ